MSATIINDATIRAMDDVAADINAICTLRLFTDGPVAGTRTAVPGDFTEATFSGYAGQSVAFPAAGLVVDGEANTTAPTISFVASGFDVEAIKGYYLTYNDGTDKVFAFQYFALPLTVSSPGDTINVQLTGDMQTPIV